MTSAYRGFRVIPDLLRIHHVIGVSRSCSAGDLCVWPATYSRAIDVVSIDVRHRVPSQADRMTAPESGKIRIHPCLRPPNLISRHSVLVHCERVSSTPKLLR